MEDLGSVFQVIAIVIAVASAAGLGVSRGTSSNLRNTITDLRGELADAAHREARAKSDAADAATALAELRSALATQIATLESDREALARVVTGEAHLVALSSRMEEALEALAHIQRMIEQFMGGLPNDQE